MPIDRERAADEFPLRSAADAERFLAHYLPIATAANPKYRTGENMATAWLTKSISFSGAGDERSVFMHEEVLQYRNGVPSAKSSHDVGFRLGDVSISEHKDDSTLTEGGEAAIGVYFTCRAGKCVQSTYDGKPAPSEGGDISIQDDEMRGKILKAFLLLKPGAT